VRSRASAKRATGTTSIPTPTITRGSRGVLSAASGFVERSRRRGSGRAGRGVVGEVTGECRDVRVEIGGSVVHRGGNFTEAGGDQLDLAFVVDDVARGVDPRHGRAARGVDDDL